LCLALHGSRVICSDPNIPPGEAVKKHRKYNVSHFIEYESLDATDIPYKERFDIVLFKSVLGDIGRSNNKHNQAKAINEIYVSLKQGGELFFAENLVASPIHSFLRGRCIRWGNVWRYVRIEEMRSFLSSFSSVKYCTIGFLGVFGRNEKQRQVLGAIDRAFLDSIVPQNWRYIIVGVAKK
jgi:SAM-dependent methyltransferase